VPVTRLPLPGLLNLAFDRIRARRKTLFTTTNAHSIVVARRQPLFAAHFREADAVLPDGISAVWGVRACGGAIRERVSGPDFFEAFLARAAIARVSVFLLGTNEETLRLITDRCRSRWPGLIIKGTLAPPYGELSDEVNRGIVQTVNRVRPDALFVAMTAPKQELWISRHLSALDVRFVMGVGAAFDFFAGNKHRAPQVFRSLGVEWVFRLLLEPRRLWRRNVDSLVFLWLLAGVALRRLVLLPSAPSAPEVDARASARYPVGYSVTIGGARGRTLNASTGGLCLEFDQAVQVGAKLEGSIRLAERDVAFVGHVAWTMRDGSSASRRQVGVRFTEIRDDFALLAGLGDRELIASGAA
jgi:N-acetylglucosaminyldiphosphoundecaprenol N-acetyl-beta-D-mannosaminyltransferase